VLGTTGADGIANFTVTDNKVETVSYSATDTTDNLPITGQSVSVTFTTPTSASATTTTTPTSTSTSTSTTPTTAAGGAGAAASTAATGNTGAGGSAASTAATGNTGAGSGATLALTGTPSSLPWLFAFGAFLFVVGAVGRRVSHVRP
jgi:hypothetical protein